MFLFRGKFYGKWLLHETSNLFYFYSILKLLKNDIFIQDMLNTSWVINRMYVFDGTRQNIDVIKNNYRNLCNGKSNDSVVQIYFQ